MIIFLLLLSDVVFPEKFPLGAIAHGKILDISPHTSSAVSTSICRVADYTFAMISSTERPSYHESTRRLPLNTASLSIV